MKKIFDDRTKKELKKSFGDAGRGIFIMAEGYNNICDCVTAAGINAIGMCLGAGITTVNLTGRPIVILAKGVGRKIKNAENPIKKIKNSKKDKKFEGDCGDVIVCDFTA